MAWLDNVGWPKVVLLLGFFGMLIATVVYFPDAADWLKDLWSSSMDFISDIFGGSQ